MSCVTPDDSARTAFICALVERFLHREGLDIAAAQLVEAGLRTGRQKELRPPDQWRQPTIYYPGLTAKPWHDPACFAWVGQLEAGAPDIVNECVALLEAQRFSIDPLSVGLANGSWQEVRLYSEGWRHNINCASCPRTAALVAGIAGATTAGLVYFSAIGPGTHLMPHYGPHNARLRCHLGLVIPEGCRMRVGPETRNWSEGKVLVFDDSYQHEVWNDSDRTRMVLVLDVWHPDLTPSQIAAIRYSSLPFVEEAYAVAEEWVRTGIIPRL